jgi:Thioesterase-like superfamily
MATLRTRIAVVHAGRRGAVIDSTLYVDGEAEPLATARIQLLKARAVDVTLPESASAPVVDPLRYPRSARKAPHGKPWFMDAMEVRSDGVTSWFRLETEIIKDAGPLSTVLAPADWAHGINRPLSNVLADPNPDLTVRLFRPPVNDWIGVRSRTWWSVETGIGLGAGNLHDVTGEIGSVAMSVALMPFPTGAVKNRPA